MWGCVAVFGFTLLGLSILGVLQAEDPIAIEVKCPQTGTAPINDTMLRAALEEWGYNASFQIDATVKYGPISTWDTSNVETFQSMFITMVMPFNASIGCWDTSAVTTMNLAFNSNSIFDQDISDWDTGKVSDMGGMFILAHAFNQPIGKWDTSAVTNMAGMFSDATAFNQDLGGWDTSNVISIATMFVCTSSVGTQGPCAFNNAIGSGNWGNPISMEGVFSYASAFNYDIGSWDTGNATNMLNMFYKAKVFNQDIGSWNTAQVTTMKQMFEGALAFDQDISSWDNSSLTLADDMVDSSGMSCVHFKALRCAWSVAAGTLATTVSETPGNCTNAGDAC